VRPMSDFRSSCAGSTGGSPCRPSVVPVGGSSTASAKKKAEPGAMPGDHGLRFHDDQGLGPTGPQ
jgi:hypothetical protein